MPFKRFLICKTFYFQFNNALKSVHEQSNGKGVESQFKYKENLRNPAPCPKTYFVV